MAWWGTFVKHKKSFNDLFYKFLQHLFNFVRHSRSTRKMKKYLSCHHHHHLLHQYHLVTGPSTTISEETTRLRAQTPKFSSVEELVKVLPRLWTFLNRASTIQLLAVERLIVFHRRCSTISGLENLRTTWWRWWSTTNGTTAIKTRDALISRRS